MEYTKFNDGLFDTYKKSSLKSKTIQDQIKAGNIPTLPCSKQNNTKPMCLAWHTKGICSINCPCLYDHAPYTPNEYALLFTWCHDHGYKTT
jgi:hypothetical protein